MNQPIPKFPLDTASPTVVFLGPEVQLTCETVDAWAQNGGAETMPASLSPCARRAMTASREAFCRLRENNAPIYGTTTGFGPHVAFGSGDGGTGGYQHGANLLAHLGAGWGMAYEPDAPPAPVRAAVLVRAQNLAQGWSGVRPELVDNYLRVVQAGIVPCVPPIGSVGASGDLVPLSHIARVFAGTPDSRALFGGETMSGQAALLAAGLTPAALEGRDALALTNGTSFLTAYAALAVARTERLFAVAENLTGWMYRLLGARASALDERLHKARGHDGQQISARNIACEANRFGDYDGEYENAARALQEVYSVRCAPQVLGACRENLAFARRVVETEINGVSDNPLFPGDAHETTGDDVVLHGGNFHGQQVGFAADALNAALTQAAVLAERQIDLLVTPSKHNDFAPLLLAWEPGACSGLAGAQITATALVAEMRAHANAHATLSMPTNGNNQDVVSMGTLAARMAYEQAERLSAVLAVLSMATSQLFFLRQAGRASVPAAPRAAPPPWMPPFAGLDTDRPLRGDIARIAHFFLTQG